MPQPPDACPPADPTPAHAIPVDWAVSRRLVGYPEAVRAMEARVEGIVLAQASELVWLLEHPPIYTGGTGARPEELLDPDRFPVLATGRGGKFTYHGPGQRVIYVMLDVKRRSGDVRAFVAALEAWVIDVLADLGVAAETRPGRVGIWVPRAGQGEPTEDKIAAIGLRLRKWVSLHGISLNVSADLGHYAGIVPCGIAGHGVTSLAQQGVQASMEVVDKVLRARFESRFGPTRDVRAPLEPQPVAPAGAQAQP